MNSFHPCGHPTRLVLYHPLLVKGNQNTARPTRLLNATRLQRQVTAELGSATRYTKMKGHLCHLVHKQHDECQFRTSVHFHIAWLLYRLQGQFHSFIFQMYFGACCSASLYMYNVGYHFHGVLFLNQWLIIYTKVTLIFA